MAEKERIDNLFSRVDEILDSYRPELYKKGIFKEPSFLCYGKGRFDRVFELIGKIKKYDLSLTPDSFLDPVCNKIGVFRDFFEKAKSLSDDEGNVNVASARDEIVKNVERSYGELFEVITRLPIFPDGIRGENKDLKEIERKGNQLLASIKETKDKGDKILGAIRTTSTESGTQPNIDYYRCAVKKHAVKARKWFGGGVGIFGVLSVFVVSVLWAFKGEPFSLGYSEIACIVVFIALGYGISFCGRNYYAEKHNETVNEYKDRSLSTFRPLYEGTGDEEAKAQILVQACASIFANSATGYNKGQEVLLPLPTIEVARQAKKLIDKKD